MKYTTKKTTTAFAVSIMLATMALLAANTAVADDHAKAPTENQVIDKKMDDFHDAADKGDKTRYLNHFTKDAVFMGTDDWERWPYEEFSKYVNLRFKDGKGWSYKPIQRFTNFNSQYDTAWVDEIVESEKWGRFRGTAVLAKIEQGWKLRHYSLTMLVPNESWVEVSDVAKKAFEERTVEAGIEPPAAAE